MDRTVVTGAGGFLGYALTQRLLDGGAEVYAVVRERRGQWERLEQRGGCHVVVCGLEDMGSLDSLVGARGFDAFYHLAWQGVSGPDSGRLDVQLGNVRGTAAAAEAAARMGCRRFVFASSIMEYELDKLMQGTLPSGWRNLYRAAKKMAAAVARTYCNGLGVAYHSALITNVYGPGDLSPRFVSSTLRKMLRGEELRFSEASQMYDFCYIDDATAILELAGEKGEDNRTYYVGSAQPRPLREFILEMAECAGVSPGAAFGAGGEYVGVSLDYDEFDIRSTEEGLGYRAGTGFREGVRKTIKWLRAVERLEG